MILLYITHKNIYFSRENVSTVYPTVYKLHNNISMEAKSDLEESLLIRRERNEMADLCKFAIKWNICSYIPKEFYWN